MPVRVVLLVNQRYSNGQGYLSCDDKDISR
jgi:hypothetical protein